MRDDYVSRKAVMESLTKEYNRKAVRENGGLQLAWIEKAVNAVPAATPEHLQAVVEKIKEKYDEAMKTTHIRNPMAWALYQTWKEYDK